MTRMRLIIARLFLTPPFHTHTHTLAQCYGVCSWHLPRRPPARFHFGSGRLAIGRGGMVDAATPYYPADPSQITAPYYSANPSQITAAQHAVLLPLKEQHLVDLGLALQVS